MAWLGYLLSPLATFAVQTDDFVIIGVLPAMADGLSVSDGAAGQLVTVFTLVYAIAAPVSAVVFARVGRRALLAGALLVFCAANFAVPFVDSYPVLMALRVVAALCGATVLPAALALATGLAPAGSSGRYLATVMMGLTGAVVVGVPAGTWVGAAFGWQATFVLGGLLGLVALVAVVLTLRSDTGAPQRPPLAGLARALASGPVLGILAATILAVAGNLAFQTYLAPFLAGLAGVTPGVLGVLLVAAGVAGIVGAQGSGWCIDRLGATRSFALAALVFAAAMIGFAVSWTLRPVPLAVVIGLLVCWSAAAWAVPPTIQALMLAKVGAEHAAPAMAVNSSTVYLGAAIGAAGGAVVGSGGIPVLAASSALAALLVIWLSARRRGTTGRRRPGSPASRARTADPTGG